MKKTAPATVHVSPDTSGGWLVQTPKSATPQTYPTQAEAVSAPQSSISCSGGQISIRNANGRTSNTFTLGRAAMEKINAVEGIVLSDEVRDLFVSFDDRDLPPEQRRAELRSVLAEKAKR